MWTLVGAMDTRQTWIVSCARVCLHDAKVDGYATCQWSEPWSNPRPLRRDASAFPRVCLSDMTRVSRRRVPHTNMHNLRF